MILDTVREKLVNRVFDGLKNSDEIKKVYQTNGAKRFAEYISGMKCRPMEIYNFTDAHAHYMYR